VSYRLRVVGCGLRVGFYSLLLLAILKSQPVYA
jgi:hypothetical protein